MFKVSNVSSCTIAVAAINKSGLSMVLRFVFSSATIFAASLPLCCQNLKNKSWQHAIPKLQMLFSRTIYYFKFRDT